MGAVGLLWRLENGKPLGKSVELKINPEDKSGIAPASLAFSKNGGILMTGDGLVRLWDVRGDTPAMTYQAPDSDAGGVGGVALSRDGKRAVSYHVLPRGATEDTLRLSTVVDGKLGPPEVLWKHPSILSVAISSDSNLVAAGAWDGKVCLHDLGDSGADKSVAILTEHSEAVYGLAFSPDGKVLASASASSDGKLVFWDVCTRKVRRVVVMPMGLISVVFAHDGRHVLVSAADGAGYVVRVPER
jgi:WD40 repeat protein